MSLSLRRTDDVQDEPQRIPMTLARIKPCAVIVMKVSNPVTSWSLLCKPFPLCECLKWDQKYVWKIFDFGMAGCLLCGAMCVQYEVYCTISCAYSVEEISAAKGDPRCSLVALAHCTHVASHSRLSSYVAHTPTPAACHQRLTNNDQSHSNDQILIAKGQNPQHGRRKAKPDTI